MWAFPSVLTCCHFLAFREIVRNSSFFFYCHLKLWFWHQCTYCGTRTSYRERTFISVLGNYLALLLYSLQLDIHFHMLTHACPIQLQFVLKRLACLLGQLHEFNADSFFAPKNYYVENNLQNLKHSKGCVQFYRSQGTLENLDFNLCATVNFRLISLYLPQHILDHFSIRQIN